MGESHLCLHSCRTPQFRKVNLTGAAPIMMTALLGAARVGQIKAVVIEEPNRRQAIDDPTPGPGDIVVKVEAWRHLRHRHPRP